MAFIPSKMDETQIAFLANEITKTYMTGKNTGSGEEFAREYFNMYQNSMKVIVEQQQKQNEPYNLMDVLDSAPLSESQNSRVFR